MFRNPLTDGLVIIVVLLLFFGPKRLPMLTRSIGESIKEFKGGIGNGSSKEEDEKPQLPAESQAEAPASTPAARQTADAGTEHNS